MKVYLVILACVSFAAVNGYHINPSNIPTTINESHAVTHNKRDPQQSVHLSAREYDPKTDGPRDVENWLEIFIARLKAYINKPVFDIGRFKPASYKLDKELNEIVSFANKVGLSKDLAEKLTFAQTLFDFMFQSIEHIGHYDFVGPPEERLVNFMIELNLGLFNLFDSQGRPNPCLPGYAQKVKQFNTSLKTWKYEFGKLVAPEFGARMMFAIQITRAETKLELLEAGIPQEKTGP